MGKGPLLLKLTSLQFWLGLGVSVLLLVILVLWVGLDEIRDALSEANYVYVIPAIGLYFVAVYFRALRWRYLLSPLGSFSPVRLYPVVVIGYMANNVLPARLGELVRSYYLARRERVSASATLATVAVERVYDGVTLLAFAGVSGLALLLLGEFSGGSDISRITAIVLASLTALAFLWSLLFLTLLATSPGFVDLFDRVLVIIPSRIRPKARDLYHTFVQGLSILNSPRRHLGLFVLSVPVWLLEAGVYLVIGYSFGIDALFGSFWVLVLVVLLVTATSNLATSVPASIGGIGPFEVVAQQTLLALGVGGSLAVPYALVVHIVALWLPVNLLGLALLWKQNLSLRQLAGTPPAPAMDLAPEFATRLPHTHTQEGPP